MSNKAPEYGGLIVEVEPKDLRNAHIELNRPPDIQPVHFAQARPRATGASAAIFPKVEAGLWQIAVGRPGTVRNVVDQITVYPGAVARFVIAKEFRFRDLEIGRSARSPR